MKYQTKKVSIILPYYKKNNFLTNVLNPLLIKAIKILKLLLFMMIQTKRIRVCKKRNKEL